MNKKNPPHFNSEQIENSKKLSPLFTVIILLYNNSRYLQQCLDSVLIQNYSDIEIIVVDDHSDSFDKDGIERYISEHQTPNIRKLIVYQNESNYGTVKSANGAILKACGSFIKLLAADDALYDQDTLCYAAKALRESPCGIITGNVMRCDKGLVPIKKYRNLLLDRLNRLTPFEVFRCLCVHDDIVSPGVFFDKSFFEEYGLFDESYRLIEDWPMWLKATKEGCRIVYSSFWAVKYRSNSGIGTSTNAYYMQDKKLVLNKIIIPAKKELGWYWYLKARFSFFFINSPIVRKTYGFFFRKGN